MNITTHTGLVGFLLALSTLNVPPATAATNRTIAENPISTLEGRLNRTTAAIRERETQLQGSSQSAMEQLVAIGWADGNGRDWVNSRAGGWADGHGRGFANVNPWRNAWVDGGGFTTATKKIREQSTVIK